jgi:NAD(P)-dependent dehydrogenase (short-subunit alcohol dehydrogenase family)
MEDRGTYGTTKGGLVGFSRVAALELGPFGITVNCIAPGPFLTGMQARFLSDEQAANLDYYAKRTALCRLGDPAEMAGPAVFLASDAGSYVTGTVLVVDGGTLIREF